MRVQYDFTIFDRAGCGIVQWRTVERTRPSPRDAARGWAPVPGTFKLSLVDARACALDEVLRCVMSIDPTAANFGRYDAGQ